MKYRIEQDLLGEKNIPEDALWGIHTERAKENFLVSELKIHQEFICALAQVKKASILTNLELSFIDAKIARALIDVCDEIIDGKLMEFFPLDALQGGAGTSTNMNINEVIANRALTKLSEKIGNYKIIDPIETVNLHQSTNDVYPTALKVASIQLLRKLSEKIEKLQGVLQRKEKEFAKILFIARTELQEAVPMTMGAQFASFAEAIARDRWRTYKAEERLRIVNLGGTAIGTSLCAPKRYVFMVVDKLREITSLGLARADNMIDITANTDMFVEVSSIIKANAVNLIKIADDLRRFLLLDEIKLKKMQSGSSIMPNKVNPVLLEAIIQGAIKVKANDFIVSECVARASFQINEFMPLMSYAFLESIKILININELMRKVIIGLDINKEVCENKVNESLSIITAFVPHIGYKKCEALIKEFMENKDNISLKKFLINKLGDNLVDKVLNPFNLI